jgi:indolepyruvate ferredoxin oxidoreductase, beta subunit
MRTIRIMIVAVGGQGNILASRVLGEAAVSAGVTPRMSEFHGMAQRGGVVESMVLLGEGLSYCIPDGQADVLLGFEPSETIRSAVKCAAHSVVITNTVPLPPFTVALGRNTYPDTGAAMALLSGRVSRLAAFDALALATRAGSPRALNMVMLGALAASGVAPVDPVHFRQAIGRLGKRLVEPNLAAFELGMAAYVTAMG